jgi:hypothetical protein
LALCAASAFAQLNVLTVQTPPRVVVKRNGEVSVKIPVHLRPGYHVNSNKPNDDYLIPLRVTWNSGAVAPMETIFPAAKDEIYKFSAKPVSVFTGRFEILQKFRAPADAPQGPALVTGRLRYQACTETACLQPRNLDIKLQVEVQ